jgi:MFS transporter, ACS family, glucarate transporter
MPSTSAVPLFKKRHQVLTALAVLSAITFLDRIAISSAALRIQSDLGISVEQWGWVLSVFVLSYGGFEVPTGLLGDRLGAKPVLIRVVVWWSIFTALTGLVSGFWMLLIVRFLFGMGEAGAYPNTSITLSKWFPRFERGRAQAIIWAASRVGAALTPVLVVPIQRSYGWRNAFFLLAILGFSWAIFWKKWFKETPEQDSSVSPAELTEITTQRQQIAIDGDSSIGVFFQQRNLWMLMLMYFCYASGAFFFQSWFITYLQKGRQLSETDTQLFASYPFLLAALGCLLGGFLSDRLVRRIGLTNGRRFLGVFSLFISGLLILGVTLTDNNVTAIVLLSLGMAVMDITAPVAWAVSMDIGGQRSGTISGAMNCAGLAGAYLTTLSFGYLVKAYGYHMPVQGLGVLLLIGAFFWWQIDAAKPLRDR